MTDLHLVEYQGHEKLFSVGLQVVPVFHFSAFLILLLDGITGHSNLEDDSTSDNDTS